MKAAYRPAAGPWVLALLVASACGSETLGQKVDRLSQEAKDASEQAVHKTAKSLSDGAGGARDWVLEKHATGELTSSAMAAMNSAGEGISHLASRSAQLAPVALEVGKVLYAAVDKDIDIEPIFVRVDDEEAQSELDESIHDMPRVETIDGLDVGFKDVSESDSGSSKSESAYLVVWRQGERLIGFVYRSKSEVDIDKMIAEAPRLIALAKAASQAEPT